MLQEEGKEVAVEVAVKDLQPIGTLRRLGRRGEGSQEQSIGTLRRLGRHWGGGVKGEPGTANRDTKEAGEAG